MKWIATIFLALVAIITLYAQHTPKLSDVSPSYHLAIAIDFLQKIDPSERPYIRFLSSYNYQENEKELAELLNINKFWLNQLHRESDIEFSKEVPNTNNLLHLIDIRDYGWTDKAWLSAIKNEPYFNDSNQLIIARTDWFIRETSDQDRSDAYFDLIFAKERFNSGSKRVDIDWKGGEYNGEYLKPGKYYYTTSDVKSFPNNEADFEKTFGVNLIRQFIKETKLNLQRGAVVEGGEKGVSIVARHNRLIERTEGPIGWYYKTYDVKESTGKRDFAETLQKDFEFDAGEILARLPAGGQMGLLVDSKGKILATADNRFANDSSDYKFDTRVRNYTSCAVCHSSGIIKPENLIEDMLKSGIDIKFKNKKDARDARSFFLNWDRKLAGDQGEFADFIKRTSGFTPDQNSLIFKKVRDKYDSPVTLEIAAKELGVSIDMFKRLGARSTKARILMLVQGKSIPRRTWESDAYKEMTKLLNADRK